MTPSPKRLLNVANVFSNARSLPSRSPFAILLNLFMLVYQ